MEMKQMADAVRSIEMPQDMKTRIIRNCRETCAVSETKQVFFQKPVIAFASFALCFALAGTSLAASGKLAGFFRDIKNRNNAVTGTAYEQASDEILIEALDTEDSIIAEVTFLMPDKVPYSEITQLALEEYRIEDNDGKTVTEGSSSVLSEIRDGKVIFTIPADTLPSGNYRLIITKLSGHKKADAPLMITGIWVIPFTR